MKKYLIFLFVALLCVTGCGNKTDATQDLKDAFLKLKDTDAISVKATINMGSEEMKIPLTMEISYNETGIYMNTGVSLFGMEQKEEIYMLKKEDLIYTYIYDMEEDSWSYTKVLAEYSQLDNEEFNQNSDQFNELIDNLVDTFDGVKKVKSDKDGYEEYEVNISKKTLLDSVKEGVEDEEELAEINESFKDLPDTLTFTIYLKDGEVSIFSMELSDVEIPMDGMEGMNMQVFDITVELVARNEDVKIELPKEAEENATEILAYPENDALNEM